MKGALAVFRFITDAAARSERTVLVTLTHVLGSSSRAPGTHMAVGESGTSIGSFSAGCIEAAVVGEALATLAKGTGGTVRYGVGSPYIDIRLPCGGGIDLLFTPDPAIGVISEAAQRLRARESVALLLTRQSCFLDGPGAERPIADGFTARHDPDLQLIIAGHGDEVQALARLAGASGIHTRVYSPDLPVLDAARSVGAGTQILKRTSDQLALDADRFTAIAFLFHDHDWEETLVPVALASPAFFVGAMGSLATHDRRKAMLRDRGVPAADIDRIVGPMGLLPRSRDPDTLAISILAQIVQAFEGIHENPSLHYAELNR